jgi:HEAT repeat protein
VNLDSDRRNRIAALEILAKQHDESTFTYILGALMNDESPEVRLRAIELMGASDNPLATRALEDSAKNDRDDNVRQAARDMAERRKSNANP